MNSSTRTRFAIAVVVAQLAVLGFMAGEREWVVRTGQVMFLRTAPVDPRDPMRGDYARFDYEIAHVPRGLCRDGVLAWFTPKWEERRAVRDRRVYAEVELDDDRVARLVALSDIEPTGRLFVRGRVASLDEHRVNVRYGVEALFLEQGKGIELENSPKLEAGVPLNIEVAVGDNGLAVAKGYRWEPLGITLALEWRDVSAVEDVAPNRRVLEAITVELKNHGEEPVAIVARPDAGSFRLLADERWNQAKFRWVGEDLPVSPATAEAVTVLQPGEPYRERLDLTSQEWFLRPVREGGLGPPMSWEKLVDAWGASFRIEYVAPTRDERAGLPHAELIQASGLRSRAFTPVQGVD